MSPVYFVTQVLSTLRGSAPIARRKGLPQSSALRLCRPPLRSALSAPLHCAPRVGRPLPLHHDRINRSTAEQSVVGSCGLSIESNTWIHTDHHDAQPGRPGEHPVGALELDSGDKTLEFGISHPMKLDGARRLGSSHGTDKWLNVSNPSRRMILGVFRNRLFPPPAPSPLLFGRINDDRRFVRAHIDAKEESTRSRSLSSRHLGSFILESEKLDERPYTLFLTAGWKSLGTCQIGDPVKACPQHF